MIIPITILKGNRIPAAPNRIVIGIRFPEPYKDLESTLMTSLKTVNTMKYWLTERIQRWQRDLLMEFSKDEYMHAQNFLELLFANLGRMYQPGERRRTQCTDDFEKA